MLIFWLEKKRWSLVVLILLQIIELLSVRAPSAEVKLKLLKEIAEEHKLEWDPAASESELSKPHADLLVSAIHPCN